MTAAAGRLVLVDPSPRGAEDEPPRLAEVGVLMLGVEVLDASRRFPLITVISDTSRSSSSSSKLAARVACDLSWSCDFEDHRPLGSIVTASRLLGVFSSISLTYLPSISHWGIVGESKVRSRTRRRLDAQTVPTYCRWGKAIVALAPEVVDMMLRQSIEYVCS